MNKLIWRNTMGKNRVNNDDFNFEKREREQRKKDRKINQRNKRKNKREGFA